MKIEINGNSIETHNNTITLRRNSMKQQITSIAVAGIAAVVIAAAGIMGSISEVHADSPAKAKVVMVYANTSPDLPEMDNYSPAKLVKRAVAGGSPDLPEMDNYSPAKLEVRPFIGGPFANTSPDLPRLDDAKVIARTQAGADPEEAPEMFHLHAKVRIVGTMYPNTSPDLPRLDDAKVIARTQAGADPEEAPEMFYRTAKVRLSGGMYPNTSPDLPRFEDAKLAVVEPELPLESFAYWSIDPGTVVNDGALKVTKIDRALPNESFAYFSIEGINVTVNSSEVIARTYIGTSPDLPATF